jgi:hypothetical protein
MKQLIQKFCNSFWVANAREMPEQTVRTSDCTAGRCGNDAVRTALTNVSSQHDVAGNEPWRVNDVTQQTAVTHWHKNRRPQNWHNRRCLCNSDRPSTDTFSSREILHTNRAGLATRYGMGGSGIKSRWWRDFHHLSRPTLGLSSLQYNGYRVLPGGKQVRAWLCPPTQCCAEVKERIEQHLYFPSGLSWTVIGWPLYLYSTFYGKPSLSTVPTQIIVSG